jgi:hypothetical protein
LVPGEIRMTKVGELKEHPRNPRRGDVGVLADSIRSNGFFQVVVAQEGTGHILAGNHRFRTAVDLGLEVLPVYWVSMEDTAALRLMLADNRTSDLGDVDHVGLGRILMELRDAVGNLEGTGYGDEFLEGMLSAFAPPDVDGVLEEYGVPDDRTFWPEFKVDVYAEDVERWHAILDREDGDDVEAKVDALTRRLP